MCMEKKYIYSILSYLYESYVSITMVELSTMSWTETRKDCVPSCQVFFGPCACMNSRQKTVDDSPRATWPIIFTNLHAILTNESDVGTSEDGECCFGLENSSAFFARL